MIRFNAQDGLVSVIADDIIEIQDAVQQNILDRLGVTVKRHGVKGDTNQPFTLSSIHAGLNTFEVRCTGVGPVVFGDYVYVVNEATEVNLSVTTTLADSQTKYIYLTRTISYSNDQEDNFEDGHPVDEDGNPPASGYNIESDHVLELGVAAESSLPTAPIVILGTVTRVGSSYDTTIQDKRRSNALTLNDFGLVQPNDVEIENLEVASLHQTSIIKSRAMSAPSGTVDRAPSQTDMTANKTYLEVSWDQIEDAFAYQIQLEVLDPEDRTTLQPISEIVPNIEGEERISTFMEVLAGIKYRVSVRMLSGSPNHDPGPWAWEDLFAGVPDFTETDGIPPPELSVVSLHGNEESSFMKHLVQINATPSEATPEPFYVQIYRMSSSPAGVQALADEAKLIYEGNAQSFLYNIPLRTTCYFGARTVGPGNLCSWPVWSEAPFVSPDLVEDVPPRFAIHIPIGIFWTKASDANPFELLSFNLPAPYCRLMRASFYPHGSAIITSGDDTYGVELVFDQEGSFAWLDGETNGKTADTSRKMVWNADSTYPMFETSTTGINYNNQDEYYQGYRSFWWNPRPPADPAKGSSWSEDDIMTIWLAAYDLDAGTDYINLAGDLILEFEKTAVEMTEEDD